MEDLSRDGFDLRAYDGMESGIVFQRRREDGVGNAKVIDLGFLDAVDVSGNIGNGYEVCLSQIGRIVFLDAAAAPSASALSPAFLGPSARRSGRRNLLRIRRTDCQRQ